MLGFQESTQKQFSYLSYGSVVTVLKHFLFFFNLEYFRGGRATPSYSSFSAEVTVTALPGFEMMEEVVWREDLKSGTSELEGMRRCRSDEGPFAFFSKQL